MKTSPILKTCLLLALASPAAFARQIPDDLKTKVELTDYQETSTYAEVTNFFNALEKHSPLVRVETFGYTQEGRPMPLVILSDPPISTPRDAHLSGKPIVFFMANIHAGEVEGKEAMQLISRRIALGDLRSLLDKIILITAPIYNADGNEKFSLRNRTDQNGPIGGVGVRENSSGLDLNRDYVKMEAPETRALIKLMNDWDPAITTDLHTTDGSYIAYHMTYSIPLNPSIDPAIYAYHRETLMPAISSAMLSRHNFRSYYYGNFEDHGKGRAWYAFSPLPRAGQNYVGFRNRLTILSEAYSHLDFKGRVDVTEAFVEEISKYMAVHGVEVLKMEHQADVDVTRHGIDEPPMTLGFNYENEPLPKPVKILAGAVEPLKNPRITNSTAMMQAMVKTAVNPTNMIDYGLFEATNHVLMGRAYLFKPEAGMKTVLEKLRGHGITIEELTEPVATEVETFTTGAIGQSRFQRNTVVQLSGKYHSETQTFPAGTIVVRTAQPLGILAAYLLEPESDDGLASWNFLAPYIGVGRDYPIHKLTKSLYLPCEVVPAPEPPKGAYQF